MSVLPSRKTKVQTQGKRENGVLHTDVSLDMLDKRARLGATGARTKNSLVDAGIHRQRLREKLPAAGWINRASVRGLGGLTAPRAEN